METLIKEQTAQQELLQKCITNTKKEAKERRKKAYYQRRMKQFEDLWAEFQNRHKQILILQYSTENFDVTKCDYFANEIYEQMEEFFMTNVAMLEENIQRLSPPDPSSLASNITTEASFLQENKIISSIRMPKVTMDKFRGDYKRWTTFHDLFKTMVHDNMSYAPVQKLQYLKLLLEGEPENLIRHLQITDDNYEIAWALLKERYENKRVLVWFQLETLFNQPICSTETASGIKKLLDTTTECLLALSNLNIDVEGWDPLVVYWVVKRLPPSTHQLWEQSIGGQSDLPTWKILQEFLKTRFRTLEAISSNKSPIVNQVPRPTNVKPQAKTFHISKAPSCILCTQPHNIRQCPKFAAYSISSRMDVVKTKGLCINCLGYGHRSSDCPSKQRCRQCHQRHHTLLHNSKPYEPGTHHAFNTREQTSNADITQSNVNAATVSDLNASVSRQSLNCPNPTNYSSFVANKIHTNQVLLATALVRVVSPNGREQVVRALIDQGSQASFITQSIMQDLHLKGQQVNATIQGLGKEVISCARHRTTFSIKPLKGESYSIEVTGLVLRKLTDIVPIQTIHHQNWTHLRGLNLADPEYYRPGRVDLLLGADVYGKILMNGLIKGSEGTPIAQKTTLGWILSGEIRTQAKESIRLCNFHLSTELNDQLKKFWELEEIPEKPMQTEEEAESESIFEKTTTRRPDGRYEVKLPFKPTTNTRYLGRSRHIAIARLLQMERRFKKDPKLQEEYNKCLTEYLELGHMTKVTTAEDDHRQTSNGISTYTCSYLPHHGVVKETSTTTKLRVVFDASRSTDSGTSVNDLMLKGPVVQDDLTALLIRWRKHRIAFSADLEKMYRQIRVQTPDTEYQRIVWRTSPDHPIEDYKLLTVTFGTKSAPYLATRVIQQLTIDERTNYPKASKTAASDFYVDDLLSGSHSLDEALTIQHQLLQMLKSGGFALRKWSSNYKEILKGLPSEYCETNLSCEIPYEEGVRTLGIFWHPASDTLAYTYTTNPNPPKWTKRTVLSETSKLFDPLGLLAPVIIKAKLVIQTLWLKGLDWDEQIPQEFEIEWLKYKESLLDIGKIKINRWTHYTTTNLKIELHGFSDASSKAYAAAIYMCVSDEQGKRHSTLIAAKTKVAPLKTVSLPRLELCAATLLAKLMCYVKRSLKLETQHETYAWTDSEIVIAWLQGHPTKWKTFVANRVSYIHETLEKNVWNHVPTKQNPADCASRGMSPTELLTHHLWWDGPEWLRQPRDQWPRAKRSLHTDLEQKRIVNLQINIDDDNLESRYSSLTRLIRVTAYCKRFIFNTQRPRLQRRDKYLKSEELKEALHYWIKRVQQKEFGKEIQAIQQQGVLPRQSRVVKLCPFIDEKGLLRVGGRLQHSDLPFHQKCPILLPDKCYFTNLIINKVHRDTMHGGTQLMTQVLFQQYWILNARSTIRHIVHKCLVCHRQRAVTQTQLMGHLPASRVQVTRPFTNTGVDYCGPFELKTHKGRNPKKYKAYIALFVCMATKALHLELVTDLTAEGFIAAFRRFTARRGLCATLFCDCGTNFVGANRILKKQQKQLANQINEEIGTLLENDGINFKFIPPSSPHFGGLWEAGVKATKHHIKRVIGTISLTYEEFNTTLTQIEACLNSRPLTEISTDPNDYSPLTPAHFLIGGNLLAIPEPSIMDIQLNRLERWQLVQRIVQNFWKRWKGEYLSRLQQRPKWINVQPNLKSGELILLKEDNLPPGQWALGRIIDVCPGADGLVRVATVKTKDRILKRPITKLCKLPFQTNTDQNIEQNLHNKSKTRSN